MATYAAWVGAQTERDDAIGYFARYWARVTPGRISSITGFERHLDKIQRDFAATDDEQGKAAIAAAISGMKLATAEYHKAEAVRNAIATGAMEPPPVVHGPDGALMDVPGAGPQQYELRADSNGLPQIRRAGVISPDDRMAAIEARLDAIHGLLMDLFSVAVVTQARMDELLAGEPDADWGAIWDAWLESELAAQREADGGQPA